MTAIAIDLGQQLLAMPVAERAAVLARIELHRQARYGVIPRCETVADQLARDRLNVGELLRIASTLGVTFREGESWTDFVDRLAASEGSVS